jgi:hypothetical protein
MGTPYDHPIVLEFNRRLWACHNDTSRVGKRIYEGYGKSEVEEKVCCEATGNHWDSDYEGTEPQLPIRGKSMYKIPIVSGVA